MSFCSICGSTLTALGSIERQCQNCGFIDWNNPPVGVCGRLVNNGNVLLCTSKTRGGWALPGGYINRNENLEDALIREFKEETSLDITVKRYLRSHSNLDGSVTIFFDVVASLGSMKPGDDVCDLKFFPIVALPELFSASHFKAIRIMF